MVLFLLPLILICASFEAAVSDPHFKVVDFCQHNMHTCVVLQSNDVLGGVKVRFDESKSKTINTIDQN